MKAVFSGFAASALVLTTGTSARVAEMDALTAPAPIALLIDASSGQILYSRNADRRFIPASITKVMSAFVAFELIEEKKLALDQTFTMSKQAGEEWRRKGSTMFLEPGDEVLVEDLLRGITSVSANDASIVLAEGALGSVDNWVARMNKTAAELKMYDSYFSTPNGWPDGGKTFTTANDLEKLADALITRHPDLYARFFGKEGFRFNGFAQANHDPISGVVDGADGIKTGFTNQAGNGFLGSAKRGGTRLIMVVGAVEDEQARAQISRGLIEWGFDGFERKQWFAGRKPIARAQVQNGQSNMVNLQSSKTVQIAIPKGSAQVPSFRLNYEGPLEAPIAAGEIVAEMEVSISGMPVTRIPLVAANDVEEAGLFKRISNAFAHWFG